MRYRQPYARLIPMADGSYGLESSYDAGFVAALKASLPYGARRWDAVQKLWRVAPGYEKTLGQLTTQYLGVSLDVQRDMFSSQKPKSTIRLVKVEYIGAAKDRGGDEPTATGYADGEWGIVFPLSVLRKWFEFDDTVTPDAAPTLYSVLGVKRDANTVEVKKAYRKAALTWHPDHNDAPEATQQFIRIKEAYDILSENTMRRKYDAGLALELSAQNNGNASAHSTMIWRSPLRCGLVLLEGLPTLGRFEASKILEWRDITNARGQTMVTYWPKGGKEFEVNWL